LNDALLDLLALTDAIGFADRFLDVVEAKAGVVWLSLVVLLAQKLLTEDVDEDAGIEDLADELELLGV
jgi:hypothetical protein